MSLQLTKTSYHLAAKCYTTPPFHTELYNSDSFKILLKTVCSLKHVDNPF